MLLRTRIAWVVSSLKMVLRYFHGDIDDDEDNDDDDPTRH